MRIAGIFDFLARSAFGMGGVSNSTKSLVQVGSETYPIGKVRYDREGDVVVFVAKESANG